MAHKKDDASADVPQHSALERKIDELLSLDPLEPVEPAPTPKVKKSKAALSEISVPASKDEPIDIFKGLSTARPLEAGPNADVPPAETLPEPENQVVADPTSPVNLEDAELDKAVDEVVISEGDALLAAEDVAAKLEPHPKVESQKRSGIIKKLFK